MTTICHGRRPISRIGNLANKPAPVSLAPQTEWVKTLVRGPKLSKPLSEAQCLELAEALLAGSVDPRVLAAVAASWRIRGETGVELGTIAGHLGKHVSTQMDVSGCLLVDYPSDGGKQAARLDEIRACCDFPVLACGVSAAIYPVKAETPHYDLNWRELLPQVVAAAESLEVFGLRTFLHTVLKTIWIPGALGLVKGVTHPPYAAASAEALIVQGTPSAVIVQSKSGQPELQAGRRHRVTRVLGGQSSEHVLFAGEGEGQGVETDEVPAATAKLWRAVARHTELNF